LKNISEMQAIINIATITYILISKII